MLYKSERDFGDDAVLDHARNLKVLIACGRAFANFLKWRAKHTKWETSERNIIFMSFFIFSFSCAPPPCAASFCVFEANWKARTMQNTRERNNIFVCVPFPFIQASPFRAYLAPSILHALASTRLKKAKNDACTEAYAKHLNPLKNG